ncbi:MAG: glycosyltransferase [Cyanomargarita calcarea GSE-NOS-MK-12-04C]|jgi:glycosyltransferase involved in cell wall biosynthesis|uniref:Glycosyltransferase n=1 Tax=Cyanomargarita calcarea GSE-NOS-MK-12-04C TaxID=2839659 RepID=A0A951QPX0_9CYAN|nr:glycosyltransferase [Cyanomargarita calcarea GSE-NOS-MK-12-04C]
MSFLSVIIPTYNSSETIERCLNSLICQTYQKFEICVLDGGSSDGTIAKVNNFHDHFKNIKIVSEPDKGVYDAMNKGIDLAEGKWLYFMGSDDEIFDKDVFLDISNTPVLKKHGIIYGNTYISDDTSWAKAGQVYDGYFDIKKLLTKNICHQAIFYRKELFQRFGKYKLQYPVCGDWEINLRFFSKTDSIYLDRIIAKFYGGGLSSKPENDPIGHDLKKLRQQALKDYYLRKITSFFQIA